MELKDALKLAESLLTGEKDGESFSNVKVECDEDNQYSIEVEFNWLNKEQLEILNTVLSDFPSLFYTIESKTISIYEPKDEEEENQQS